MLKRIVGIALAAMLAFIATPRAQISNADDLVPIYEWDPTWPKPLPNNWLVGPVIGAAFDSKGHIWIAHRPRGAVVSTQWECCVPAPAVMELDQAGNLVQAWGGPHPEEFAKISPRAAMIKVPWTAAANYKWPENEHNLHVDHKDNIWLGNSGGSHIVKLDRQGKLLLQIGRVGATGQKSDDTGALAGPADIAVSPKTNEAFVADGYGNRRVIVFDADTGAYKRHWGAYGKKPDDSAPLDFKLGAEQFSTTHCIEIDKDDLVWVCDRGNSRIQVFRSDGTFVRETVIGASLPGVVPLTLAPGTGNGAPPIQRPLGSVSQIAFSRDPGQRFAFVADLKNEKVWILRRADMKILGSFGHPGHFGGGGFTIIDNIAVDERNNLYVTESAGGNRIQRFLYKGTRSASTR